MSERLTTDDLQAMIPAWCDTGELIYLSEYYYGNETEKEKIGVILDFYIICVEDLSDEDYEELMEDEEWLICDVLADNETHNHVPISYIKPVTIKVRLKER